jgi:hypothetical protein
MNKNELRLNTNYLCNNGDIYHLHYLGEQAAEVSNVTRRLERQRVGVRRFAHSVIREMPLMCECGDEGRGPHYCPGKLIRNDHTPCSCCVRCEQHCAEET